MRAVGIVMFAAIALAGSTARASLDFVVGPREPSDVANEVTKACTDHASAACGRARERLAIEVGNDLMRVAATRNPRYRPIAREAAALPYPRVRAAAAVVIGATRPGAEDTPLLLALVNDPVPLVRHQAFRALQGSIDPAATRAATALASAGPRLESEAVEGLAADTVPATGSSMSFPGSRYLFCESDPAVGRAAFLADAGPEEVRRYFVERQHGATAAADFERTATGGRAAAAQFFRNDAAYADPHFVVLGTASEGRPDLVVIYRDVAFGTTGFALVTTATWPVNVAPPAPAGSAFPVIAGNGGFQLMVMPDGTVRAWGIPTFGTGDGKAGSNTPIDTPQPVPGLTNAVSAAVGADHALVLLRDGTVVGWGKNSWCELGNGDPGRRMRRNDGLPQALSPVRVTGLSHVRRVVAGHHFSIALLEDGTLRGWGRPNEGRLATPPFAPETLVVPCAAVPVPIPGVAHVKDIAAKYNHTLALLEDGTVLAWGSNAYGELGDGTREPRATAVVPRGLPKVIEVAAGSALSMALSADGRVFTWGWNSNSQAGGPENEEFRLTPTPVAGIGGVRHIAAGLGFGVAQLSDGSLTNWGEAYYGGLGNGNGGDSFAHPQRPARLGKVVTFYVAGRTNIAIRPDGTWWGWGPGILPSGTRRNALVPVELHWLPGSS